MAEPERVCSKCGEGYAPDVIFCPKDGTPLGTRKTEIADDPYIGLEVAGQLKIQQLVGIGAMGRVYRAHQQGIERDVAIKILHRELLRNPTVISRFLREAKVASRLMHPNVVQVLMSGELGRHPGDIGGEAYLAMEFLDGISLRSALAASGGAMPLPRALHVILQVCDAVGEAHAQGIVHRDLKPENVMLVRRGDDEDFVKVLDFGVARLEWADSSVATQAGAIFGTARYISPEGTRGDSVGPPSDVYSIATMLFQCLSGETPFDGDNPVAILVKHTSEPAPDVRSIARSSYVPEPIARVVDANLAKEPGQRCRDARELGRALVNAARDSGLSPDDLVVRSTLLGNTKGALQLASMERTRAMGLTPELLARMSGGAPAEASRDSANSETEGAPKTSIKAGETELVDGGDEPSGASASDEPAPGDRRSNVEPTLSDEPLAELDRSVTRASSGSLAGTESGPAAATRPPLSSSPSNPVAAGSTAAGPSTPPPAVAALARPSTPPERTSVPPSLTPSVPPPSHPSHPPPERTSVPPSLPPGSLPPVDPRASLPPWPEPEQPGSPLRRVLLVAVFFVLGVGLTLGIANALGAFDEPEPTVGSYVDRANVAIAESRWDQPAGDNVKDITDAALERWPGAKPILRVRENAAKILVRRAKQLDEKQHDEAVRFVRLAAELAPDYRQARAELEQLTSAKQPPETEGEADGDAAAPTASEKKKPRAKPAGPRKAARATKPPAPAPTPTAPETMPDEPDEPEPPPATSAGGRWL